jgi:hypothetical protein
MGLLDRLRGRELADPVFGLLRKRDPDGLWSVDYDWTQPPHPPHGAQGIIITIQRDGAPPGDADRAAWLELLTNYPALTGSLQQALWRLWERHRTAVDPDGELATLTDAAALWQALVLQGATVQPHGIVELIYGFWERDEPAWTPDCALVVRVVGRRADPVELLE